MRLAAAWTERFASRRDVRHFLAWLPDLREFQVFEKFDRSRLEQSVQKRTLKCNGRPQLDFQLKSRQLLLPKAAGERRNAPPFASDVATFDASPGSCPTLMGGRRADVGQRRTGLVNFDQYL